MGSITINRPHNECGKLSEMEITITNGSGQTITDTVADDDKKTIPVPNGIYRVFVYSKVKSNPLDITIDDNDVELTATINPVPSRIEIQSVTLEKKEE